MSGMPNPIAVSEILTYARAMGLEQRETLEVVQDLDQTYLLHWHEALKKHTEQERA